jgi:lipopolysaccharide heptosyltransferase II
MLDVKKILILRLSSIGDILLTTAFIRQVRNKYPTARITYIVKKEFQSLLSYNPHINKIIAFDPATKMSGLKDLNRLIQKENYDLIFDLHNNLRTNRLLAGLKSRNIFKIKKSKIKRAALVFLKVNLYKTIKSIPERYLEVGKKFGIQDDGQGLELFLSTNNAEDNLEILEIYDLIPGQFICIGPGAAHFTKMWPVENYQKLIKKICEETNYKIIILGSPQEKGLIKGIEHLKNVVELSGQLSLLESASIIKASAGLISNDSGLMHMAVALKKPVVSIFGSTVKELGFFPYRADATIIEHDLWCRPCSHVGRNKCPLGHFKCMRLTSTERVFEKVKTKLVTK